MIPVFNSLLREPSSPNNLIMHNLNELKNYQSEFDVITRALVQIPDSETLRSLDMVGVLRNFNRMIADCSRIVSALPFISSVKELEILEQQLNDHDQFLGELWDRLPIRNKPDLDDIEEIREWFENPQNQPLLDTVTLLDLKNADFSLLSKEFFKLRNLESLKMSADKTHIISTSIIQRFNNLKEINVEENYLMKLLAQTAATDFLRA